MFSYFDFSTFFCLNFEVTFVISDELAKILENVKILLHDIKFPTLAKLFLLLKEIGSLHQKRAMDI